LELEFELEGIGEFGCDDEFERGNAFGSFFLLWNIIVFVLFCFFVTLVRFLTGLNFLIKVK
jgi:hypothetical protein